MTGNQNTGTAKTAFRLAFAGYVGTLVAGLVAVAISLTEPTRIAVLGRPRSVSWGALVGIVLARRVRELPIRLGRNWLRRTALPFSAIPFGIAVGAALLGWLEFRLIVAVLAVAVAIAGYVVMRLAEARYVDSITDDEPAATWQWEPPGTPKLDAIVLAMWLLLGAANATTGNWLPSIVWMGLAILWVVTLASPRAGGGSDRWVIHLQSTSTMPVSSSDDRTPARSCDGPISRTFDCARTNSSSIGASSTCASSATNSPTSRPHGRRSNVTVSPSGTAHLARRNAAPSWVVSITVSVSSHSMSARPLVALRMRSRSASPSASGTRTSKLTSAS